MTASREDRASISMMNGLNAPGSTSKPRWTKAPTRIELPSNDRPLAPGRGAVVNPFDPPPFRKPSRRSIGNLTSERTLIRASRNDIWEGPAQKRQKTDHTFGSDETHTPLTSIDYRKGKTRSANRPRLAPEVVNVDAEEEDDVPPRADPRYHSRKSSASDELNLGSSANGTPSNPPRSETKPPEPSRPPGIVPDGASTKEVMQKYGEDMEDPIEPFTSDGSPGPSRRRRVAEVKGKLEPPVPKVDLGKLNATKRKSLKGGMKPKGLGLRLGDHAPTLTASALVAPSGKPTSNLSSTSEPLPISKIYLDGEVHHATNEKKINIQQKSSHTFAIMSGKSLLCHHLNVGDIEVIKCGDPCGPNSEQFMQINGTFASNPIIIHFATQDLDWTSKKYQQFLSWLKGMKVLQENLRNTSVLWRTVEWDHEEGEDDRMKQLQQIQARKHRDGHQLAPPPNHDNGSVDEMEESTPGNRGDSRPSNPPSTQGTVANLRYTPTPDRESSALPAIVVFGGKRENDKKRGLTNTGPPVANTAVRRSSRQTAQVKAAPDVDQDEVILAYPQGVPGAVNITNGDLSRLTPGEYLNDTLIEFGLKLWLKDLETSNPELASQVHVFNSFFYKKLNSNKNPEQAYGSVRKWTSKIDLFAKKYIIVPINERFHWYLAIIHEPEHVLRGATARTPPPRKQTRLSMAENMPTEALSTPDETPPAVERPAAGAVDMDHSASPSEAEVEDTLNDFQNSCSIEEPDDRPATSTAATPNENDQPLSPMSDLSYASSKHLEFPQSPTASDYGRNPPVVPPDLLSGHSDSMVIDMPDDEYKNKPPLNADAVDPKLFYRRSAKAKGKRKAEPDAPMDVDATEGEVVVLSDHPQTRIFTFDSLGTRHPAVIKRLAQYLKMEAKDKKGIENASTATGKEAAVPVQPNYCDCGLYLVHFAQTFVSDPQHYCEVILAQKTRSIANKERRDIWHDEKVSCMREHLGRRIQELSHDWRKYRLTREQKSPTEKGDDGDISSQETENGVQVVGESRKGRGGTKNTALRPRG